ncbi:MAG: hypothetical protein ACTHKZ_03280 [Lysobacteraceae bacterium]
MSSILRLSACLLLIAGLAACHQDAPASSTDAAGPAASTPDAATTSAAPAATTDTTPAETSTTGMGEDLPPIALTMDKVKAYLQAQKNLAQVEQADPALDAAQNASEEASAKYAARLQGNAKMRAAIEAAGLSTSDFARIGDALLGGMMTAGALESGQLKKIPDGIDPASVEFVRQHKAELAALMGTGSGG